MGRNDDGASNPPNGGTPVADSQGCFAGMVNAEDVEEAVLAEAGLLIPDESEEEPTSAVREDEVEKFKEFLDSVSPDDFKAT